MPHDFCFAMPEIVQGTDSSALDPVPDLSPAAWVPITSVTCGDSPRLAGASREHISLLARPTEALPPTVVHRATMRVIDGTHRLRAAALRGETEIWCGSTMATSKVPLSSRSGRTSRTGRRCRCPTGCGRPPG
jgi:hypothetical protein